METTIRINTDDLTVDVIDRIKKMFPHKTVKIIIHETDETKYTKDDPEFTKDLIERIEEYEANQKIILERLMNSDEKY